MVSVFPILYQFFHPHLFLYTFFHHFGLITLCKQPLQVVTFKMIHVTPLSLHSKSVKNVKNVFLSSFSGLLSMRVNLEWLFSMLNTQDLGKILSTVNFLNGYG